MGTGLNSGPDYQISQSQEQNCGHRLSTAQSERQLRPAAPENMGHAALFEIKKEPAPRKERILHEDQMQLNFLLHP